jgi:hypothetical protein
MSGTFSRRSLAKYAALFLVVIASGVVPVHGQEAQDVRWTLDIEILIQPRVSDRLRAQSWGRIFQQLGHAPRFRAPRSGEKLRIENDGRAGQRLVRVVGAFTPDGRLELGGRKFADSDIAQLQETLDEITLFGAGGPPSQSPTFGLTAKQFEVVTQLLTQPVESPVSLRSPVTAADGIGLPQQCRLTFTDAARSHVLKINVEPGQTSAEFAGLSKGTALAIALSQFGLGFRPLLNPAGGYNIEVDVGGEDDNLWPVGWKTKDPINRALPAMFKAVNVSLEETEVAALTEVIANQMEIPHFYSSAELNQANIDVTSLIYNRRLDRISMARLMTLVGDHFKMGLDVRVAENGKFFLWVTTRGEYLAFRSRFSHIVPGK